jgi:zinc/manganese transport system substrate-binding protein
MLSVLAGLAVGILLTACSGGSGAQEPSAQTDAGDPAAVAVVASTNVYGSIAEAIGGERVSVTSIISRPEQDPHSYEANTQDQLALSKAALVIENGGGYDDFVDSMLATAGRDDVTVLNAVDLAGIAPGSEGEVNEHVWFDIPAMSVLGGKIADALSGIDPGGADAYRAKAASFEKGLADLETAVTAIKKAHDGTPIAITEPLPLLLLQAAGLDNKTPETFSDAIEENTDVSPLAMKRTLDLFTNRQVAALVYNAQTSGPATEQLLQAAESNGIPVVPVTETLPEGQDYLSWMANTVRAIMAALDEGASGL